MNRLFLMRNPDVFQGQKYLNLNRDYFEGWYFKNVSDKYCISFIPGININNNIRKSFVQIITNESSYFIEYDIKDFKFSSNPFYIKIGNNIFSKNGISIDIKDNLQGINIKGNLKYKNIKNIKTNILNPNIMGPFSYVPYMECNHAILSMKNDINGSININKKIVDFNNGIGYIEKDWGCSFPKSYIWCQCNNFKESNASFMLSIADIPFKLFSFRGLICDLIVDKKEYRFATYNGAKIIKYNVTENILNIILRKGKYEINVKSENNNGLKLLAPIKGKMERDILESISSTITITLKRNSEVAFSDTSALCGLEVVNK